MNTSDNYQDDSYIIEERLRRYLSTNRKRCCKRSKLFSSVEECLEVPKLRQSIVLRAVQEVFSSTPTSSTKQKKFFYTEASYNISPVNSNSAAPESGDSNQSTFVFKDGNLSDKTGVVHRDLKNISKRIRTQKISSSLSIQLRSSNYWNTSRKREFNDDRRSSYMFKKSDSASSNNGKQGVRSTSNIYKKTSIAPSSSITLVASSDTSKETEKQGVMKLGNTRQIKQLEKSRDHSQTHGNSDSPETRVLRSGLNYQSIEKSNTRCYTELNNNSSKPRLSKSVNENIPEKLSALNTEKSEKSNHCNIIRACVANKNEMKQSVRNNVNSKCMKENEYCKYSYQNYNKKFNDTNRLPNPTEKSNKVMTKLDIIGRPKLMSRNKRQDENNISLDESNKENVDAVNGNGNETSSVGNYKRQSTIRKSKSLAKPKKSYKKMQKRVNKIDDSVGGQKLNNNNDQLKTVSIEPHEDFHITQIETSSLNNSKPSKPKSKKKIEYNGSLVADLHDQPDELGHNTNDLDICPRSISEQRCGGLEKEHPKPLNSKSKKKADTDDGSILTNSDGQLGLRRSLRNRRPPPRRIYGVIVTYSERVFRYYNGSFQEKTDDLSGFQVVDAVNLSTPRRKKKNVINRNKSSVTKNEDSGLKKIRYSKRRARM